MVGDLPGLHRALPAASAAGAAMSVIDIAIIGGGVVGTAIARELSRYRVEDCAARSQARARRRIQQGQLGADVQRRRCAGRHARAAIGAARLCPLHAPRRPAWDCRSARSAPSCWPGPRSRGARSNKDLADARREGFAVELLDGARDLSPLAAFRPRHPLRPVGCPTRRSSIPSPHPMPMRWTRSRTASRSAAAGRSSAPNRCAGLGVCTAPVGNSTARCVINAGGIRGDDVDALAGYRRLRDPPAPRPIHDPRQVGARDPRRDRHAGADADHPRHPDRADHLRQRSGRAHGGGRDRPRRPARDARTGSHNCAARSPPLRRRSRTSRSTPSSPACARPPSSATTRSSLASPSAG